MRQKLKTIRCPDAQNAANATGPVGPASQFSAAFRLALAAAGRLGALTDRHDSPIADTQAAEHTAWWRLLLPKGVTRH